MRDHDAANVGAILFQVAERAALGYGIVRLLYNALTTAVKRAEQQMLLDHMNIPQHGMFYRNIGFLKSAELKSDTVLACQDGVINTLVYRSQLTNIPDNISV